MQFHVVVLCVVLNLTSANLSLPEGMKQEEYCKGCKATVAALQQYSKASPKSTDYIQACQRKYFGDSDQPISHRLNSCHHLLELYKEDVEREVQLQSWGDFKHWFCFNKTYACIGARDPSVKKPLKHRPHDGRLDDDIVKEVVASHKGRVMTPQHSPQGGSRDEL